MPLAPVGPVPDSVTPFVTVTAISPALPGPKVVLAMRAPPSIANASAATVTEPPGPDCVPVAEAAISVLTARPAPSSTSIPGVVTVTEPPIPVPAVVLAISAPEATVICGAAATTEPALPLDPGSAEAVITVPGLVKVSI